MAGSPGERCNRTSAYCAPDRIDPSFIQTVLQPGTFGAPRHDFGRVVPRDEATPAPANTQVLMLLLHHHYNHQLPYIHTCLQPQPGGTFSRDFHHDIKSTTRWTAKPKNTCSACPEAQSTLWTTPRSRPADRAWLSSLQRVGVASGQERISGARSTSETTSARKLTWSGNWSRRSVSLNLIWKAQPKHHPKRPHSKRGCNGVSERGKNKDQRRVSISGRTI